MDAMSGGWGAFANSDGPGPFRSTAHGDVRDVPVEIQEALYPYRIEAKCLREDSGGPGRFRKGILAVGKDDVLVISSGGGGGYGPASDRGADRLDADVLEGYVTAEGALRDYGVELKSGVPKGQET